MKMNVYIVYRTFLLNESQLHILSYREQLKNVLEKDMNPDMNGVPTQLRNAGTIMYSWEIN